MPTCRDTSELVIDYMERATPLRTRAAMWGHLLQCEACRHNFNQMRRTGTTAWHSSSRSATAQHRGIRDGGDAR
jgi:hypothetical protein